MRMPSRSGESCLCTKKIVNHQIMFLSCVIFVNQFSLKWANFGNFCVILLKLFRLFTDLAYFFRADKKIKHCIVKMEGRLYTIGTHQFESLVELISYYERHPLYGKIKLWYPVSESVVHRMSLVSEPNSPKKSIISKIDKKFQ